MQGGELSWPGQSDIERRLAEVVQSGGARTNLRRRSLSMTPKRVLKVQVRVSCVCLVCSACELSVCLVCGACVCVLRVCVCACLVCVYVCAVYLTLRTKQIFNDFARLIDMASSTAVTDDTIATMNAVSYTHLTLPTNREV